MPGALNSGSPVSLADWDLRRKLFSPPDAQVSQLPGSTKESNRGGSDCLAQACIASAPSTRLFGWFTLCSIRGKERIQILNYILKAHSGYFISSASACWNMCTKACLDYPRWSRKCSSSAHLDYGDGRGEEGRCDHARQYLFYPQQDAFCQATNQTNNPKPNAGSQLPAVKFTGCSFICGRSVAQKPGHRKQRHVLARWQRWWTCLNLLMLLFMKC